MNPSRAELTVPPHMQLADSPDQPEGEATYKITTGGIEVSSEQLDSERSSLIAELTTFAQTLQDA